MHLFATQLFTETNSFAPFLTDAEAFQAFGFWRGTGSTEGARGQGAALAELRRLTESQGGTISESICAFAQPAGPTQGAVYADLKGQILEDLNEAMPVDAVILVLHGAMIAEDIEDCEGDLLAAIRSVVGPEVPIGVTLDLHCHVTRAMLKAADIMVAYKEYPHVDLVPRLREAFDLVRRLCRGEIAPVIRFVPCPLVGLWITTNPEMRTLVLDMLALEARLGILSVSLAHGFPWGDITEATAGAWCIADGDAALAESGAREIAERFWEIREAAQTNYISMREAVSEGRVRSETPLIVADLADNPGGGAPGDSTFALSALYCAGIRQAAFGCIWDPETVAACMAAGEGARVTLTIGGRHGDVSGASVECEAFVMALALDHAQSVKGWMSPLGATAWVRLEPEIDVVICSVRNQVYGRSAFTGLGIDLTEKEVVVVKSTQHFFADFRELSERIVYASSPGALTTDFAKIPFKCRSGDYWPRFGQLKWAVRRLS